MNTCDCNQGYFDISVSTCDGIKNFLSLIYSLCYNMPHM